MARDSEKARPHVRPPTSNAKGMVRMMEKRKTTEVVMRTNISAEGAEHALKRPQMGCNIVRMDMRSSACCSERLERCGVLGWCRCGGLDGGKRLCLTCKELKC